MSADLILWTLCVAALLKTNSDAASISSAFVNGTAAFKNAVGNARAQAALNELIALLP